MKIISIHQPEHLPWLGFIHKVMSVDEFVILDNVQYSKKYFQNRNKIRTSAGDGWITVPVLKFHSSSKINEIEISYQQKWQSKSINLLKYNYCKSEHFDDYFQDIKEIYLQDYKLLRDLNVHLLKYILNSFGIKTKLHLASNLFEYAGDDATEVNLKLAKKLNADVYLSGQFGKTYLDISKFDSENIKVLFQTFHHPTYAQVYKPFIPNMSSIDLLFNHGDKSINIIKEANLYESGD